VDAFQTFITEFSIYGYPVLFFGVLLENAGIPVPGETAVLIAGFLCSPAGGSHFHIGWVVFLTVLAAVIGDNIGFWLGHRFARPRLQGGRGFLFLTPKTLSLAEHYFTRYGIWTIFFARFVTGLRVVGALAAGTAGMHWLRFFAANACGALAWAVTMSLLGYFFGHSFHLLHKLIGGSGLVLLCCVVVLIGLPYLWRHLRSQRPGLIDRLARAQLWEGLLVAILEVVCIGIVVLIARRDDPPRLNQSVDEWVASTAASIPWTRTISRAFRILGTLPVAAVAALVLGVLIWRKRRDRRECTVLAWALLASEVVGLMLLIWLHYQIDPDELVADPLGFPGLVPLRTLAVFGSIAFLISRWNRSIGRWAIGVTAVLTLLTTGSIIWLSEQGLTEVLLELTAGGIILFAGIWWLEGYGPGLRPITPPSA
jgi:membrane-associated protein